ncbi:MAG: type II secretion system protein, partial [Armatimonadetes bacterium]|nr:type II secretion system protein [Armatimonadota bacterium]
MRCSVAGPIMACRQGRHAGMRRHRGFTLIELLVVI